MPPSGQALRKDSTPHHTRAAHSGPPGRVRTVQTPTTPRATNPAWAVPRAIHATGLMDADSHHHSTSMKMSPYARPARTARPKETCRTLSQSSPKSMGANQPNPKDATEEHVMKPEQAEIAQRDHPA